MREKKNQLIITFHTTAAAMAMEALCGKLHLPGRLIPVPRALSADCGMAWRTEPEQEQTLRKLIEENKLEISGMTTLLL